MTGSRKSSRTQRYVPLSDRVSVALASGDYPKASELLQAAMLLGISRKTVALRNVEQDAMVRLVAVASAVIECAAVSGAMQQFGELRDRLSSQEEKARSAGNASQASFVGVVRSLVEMDLRRLASQIGDSSRIAMAALKELPLLTLLSALEESDGR